MVGVGICYGVGGRRGPDSELGDGPIGVIGTHLVGRGGPISSGPYLSGGGS